MKKPSKVFRDQPTLTRADAKRLEPHLISWRHLNELMVMDEMSLEDLKRMVILEARKGKTMRPVIIRRLIGRIQAREHAHFLQILQC